MADQVSKANTFAELHVKGDPIIIYNAWDGGSARAIAAAGAKAIAVGDHPVGFAHGYTNDDFDEFSFDSYFGTIKDIARVIDLPFSVDISNAAGLDDDGLQQRIKQLLDIGVVGINFEDRLAEGGLLPADQQADRIRVIRAAADAAGIPLFINARSDIFAENDADTHADVLEEAVERAKAYQAAGASGFFAPGLMDTKLIADLCEQISLPVNIIRLPGAPSTRKLIEAGVSRISYGPVVQMEMIDWLKDKATTALAGEI